MYIYICIYICMYIYIYINTFTRPMATNLEKVLVYDEWLPSSKCNMIL